MKKRFCVLLCIMCCILVACSDNGNLIEKDSTDEIFIVPQTGIFSWPSDEEKYRTKDLGVVAVKFEGFNNTIESPIGKKEDAIEAAKNEIDEKYDSIHVYFDEKHDMWMVLFFRMDTEGGDQCVYIDKNGLTKLIVLNE